MCYSIFFNKALLREQNILAYPKKCIKKDIAFQLVCVCCYFYEKYKNSVFFTGVINKIVKWN